MVWWATDNGLKFYVSLINNNFSICSGIKYLWTFWAGMHIFRVGWLAGDCLELTSMGKSGIDSTKHQWSWVIWLEVFQVWQPGQCIQISIPKDPFWIVKKYALSSYGFFHDPHWFFSPGHFLFLDSPTNWQSILRILRSIFCCCCCLSLHGKTSLYWASHYFKLLLELDIYSWWSVLLPSEVLFSLSLLPP